MSFGKYLVLCVLLAAFPSVAVAENHYVREGATGSGTGSDWANAYTELPVALTRGDTYFVADGTYPSYNFDDADSGTALITIQKATGSTHGSDTGWLAAYGDGQASLGLVQFFTSYWILDGVSRTTTTSGHGFKIERSNADIVILVRLSAALTNVTVQYVEMVGDASLVNRVGGFKATLGATSNITLAYNHVRDFFGVFLHVISGSNYTVEHNYIARNKLTGAWHTEGVAARESTNMIFRYNTWEDIVGTCGICSLSGNSSDWEVYGNVFFYTPIGVAHNGMGHGILADNVSGSMTNIKFYNNTIVGIDGGFASGVRFVNGSPTNLVYNNLWYNNADSANMVGVTDNYNDFIDTNRIGGVAGANTQTGLTGDPFVDSAGKDFHLAAANVAGITLASPFDTDIDGKTRGADGVWDRGAYEFVAGPPDTEPPIVSITAPSDGATVSGLATISATASDNIGVSGVQFKVDGVNLGLEDTSAPYSVSWTTTDVANGGHTITVVARDAAGNSTPSTVVSVTVDNVIDTTPPSVSITEPASGATVSGAVNVTATASDNVGVSSVQFHLDGSNLGAAVTSAPYTISWNTTTVTNGTYTLTAVATDLSDNATTSTAVDVTVSNTTDLQTGLLAHYRFEEGSGAASADLSGNGNVGNLGNGPTWTTGKTAGGLGFDGLDDHLLISDSPSLDVAQITVAAWIFKRSDAPTYGVLAGRQFGTGSGDLWALYYNNSGNDEYSWTVITTAGEGGAAGPPSTADIDRWVHLAGTYDGSNIILYKDGVQVASTPFSGNILDESTGITIAAGDNGSVGEFVDVILDEVRIYNRALSAGEVLELVTAPAAPTGGPRTTP